ncbi:hypothetical protein [Streptomyces lichenis]|uniref:Uncharacterized protein n=1 Tax=Streptomyces lichenis TaxID=2306967 RepID=A0ABT0IK19_9ACTN|nr:hypothetical protein [Streptomyces lichenis]MCK8681657.1 hypothetical protein [Streptomyces lichenis]
MSAVHALFAWARASQDGLPSRRGGREPEAPCPCGPGTADGVRVEVAVGGAAPVAVRVAPVPAIGPGKPSGEADRRW